MLLALLALSCVIVLAMEAFKSCPLTVLSDLAQVLLHSLVFSTPPTHARLCSYLRASCSVSLCPLRSTGILDFSGRCLNDWRHHFWRMRTSVGSRWQPLKPPLFKQSSFPNGQFQHHHSSVVLVLMCSFPNVNYSVPFRRASKVSQRHVRLDCCQSFVASGRFGNKIDLTCSVGLDVMQVDNIVPADKKTSTSYQTSIFVSSTGNFNIIA